MPMHRTLNRDFFKTWSSEMAYVLGFFTADGNMIENRRGAHFIAFYSTNRDMIEKIRILLGSNHKVAVKKASELNLKWKLSYQLQIGSKEVFKDLIRLSMSPNKSLTIRMPKVPIQFLSHFLRGYFDGDGHVSVSTYQQKNRKSKSTIIITGFTSGSKKFLEDLRWVLIRNKIIVGGTLYMTSGYRLCFSTRDSLRLYNFMYNQERDLYLDRKKVIFQRYFNNLGA